MRRHLTALAAVVLACLGLAAGFLVTAPAHADNPLGAQSVDDLRALGYTIGAQGNADGCVYLVVIASNGVPAPDGLIIEANIDANHPTCTNYQPQVQANIDRIIAVFPPQTAPPPVTTPAATTATTATAPTTTVTDTTPVTTTVDTTPSTVTVTTVLVDPTINDRLTALEQRQATDEARIAALEAKAGIIVGEPKNVAPFTNPA